MMEFEAYLEEEEIEMIAALKLDEECRIKTNPKFLSRYLKRRKKAALKNKDFFDKKENKNFLFFGCHVVSKPKTRSLLKRKRTKSNRMKEKCNNNLFFASFDEDIAG